MYFRAGGHCQVVFFIAYVSIEPNLEACFQNAQLQLARLFSIIHEDCFEVCSNGGGQMQISTRHLKWVLKASDELVDFRFEGLF